MVDRPDIMGLTVQHAIVLMMYSRKKKCSIEPSDKLAVYEKYRE